LQSARAIHLKGLYNQDSFRYNPELKKTAAYTTDRSVLFDFITTEQFQGIQKNLLEEKQEALAQINVNDSEVVQPAADKLEESIKLSIKATEVPENNPLITTEEAITPVDPVAEKAEENLAMGKPLEFNKDEKHSFREWLQLSKLAPIERKEEPEAPLIDEEKSRKLELIDKFIETNPKIVSSKSTPPPTITVDKTSQDTSYLMTETLARVYLEQKKYSKAIQAYEILILKYPEKSVFFADRISDIKHLQQNNN
jgi:tetratricopeptide (TPR) repeat protein